ncbi:MAG: exosortase family protein XrtG [Eubacterium sp.]|nr:exosortase family protein XrtG [Eubacterium sp.]
MKWIIGILVLILWFYILHVTKKAKLSAWRFVWGAVGLFVISMVYIRPYITIPLARIVSAVAGGFGQMTGTFSSYFKYSTIFVSHASGDMTVQIDFECSGVIEILAFLSILAFFEIYNLQEKFLVGIAGSMYLVLANAIRLILICEIIHFAGSDYYYIAHTYLGRIVFYVLAVVLYFFVFTKPQVVKMKVGDFSYDHQ